MSIITSFLRMLRRRAEQDNIQSVKGRHGYYHGTYGLFTPDGSRKRGLMTLCYEVIWPRNRQRDPNTARLVIDCPRCLRRLSK